MLAINTVMINYEKRTTNRHVEFEQQIKWGGYVTSWIRFPTLKPALPFHHDTMSGKLFPAKENFSKHRNSAFDAYLASMESHERIAKQAK